MAGAEHDFSHDGVVVQYKRRQGRTDRRHLVVMFAGVGPLDGYEFDGRASRDSQAHWLWIKDKFDGQHAYYLCRNLDFAIERAVVALIDAELERLGLAREQCTLAGFSKGGFAALYLGIRHNFRNILASAPQIYLGSHTRANRPKIFAHLTGGGGQAELQLLDRLLPDALAADGCTDKNIYLFSSVQDQFHQAQIVPALPLFARYRNFNYIETGSDLVNEHSDVTRYNVPLILATLYALGENAPPRYGMVRNGNRMPVPVRQDVLEQQRQAGGAAADLNGARLAGPAFFPQGVGLLRGHRAAEPADLSTTLVLAGDGTRHEFALGTHEDAAVSFKYFLDAYCSYRLAKFSSRRDGGADLSGVPEGSYRVLLGLSAPGREAEVPLRSDTPLAAESHHGGRLYRFRAGTAQSVLDIRPILGRPPREAHFRLHESRARGSLVHLDGDFAVRGTEIPHPAAACYYLVLHGPGGTHSFALAAGGLCRNPDPFGDGLSDYTGARFGTRTGIDLSTVPPGTYAAAITLSAAGAVHTLPAGKAIRLTTGNDGLACASVRNAPGRQTPARLRQLGAVLPRGMRRRIKRLGRGWSRLTQG